MTQQINLYPPSAREVIPVLPARTIIAGSGAICAVLALVYAVALYRMFAARFELHALEAEQAELETKHKELEAVAARLRDDPSLDRSIDTLRKDLDEKARMLNALLYQAGSNTIGFSPILRGLARQTVPGLWLQEIRVEHGGRELTLIGRTLSAALLPKLMEGLGREQAFAGREFRMMRLSTVEKDTSGALEFELSTRADEKKK